MKTILTALVIAFGGMMLMSSEASAWVCTANSNTGAYGWGSHPYSLGYARRRALSECAVRTPRWGRCYLTNCR